jgi:ubiquinone/menaquinone biosynthesis C-methylase UbiE
MTTFRQKYYNLFSKFYDKFIQVHSGDKQEKLREFLVQTADIKTNDRILDICCGTGSTTYYLSKKSNYVTGADFSIGMLEKAKEKCINSSFILANISQLPFKNNSFDIVTCTFAFYEIKGELIDKTLSEIKRILKKDGKFLMMEHEVPEKPFIRFLFYIRLLSMGFKKAKNILKFEGEIFKNHFKKVEKINSPTGNSKIWICNK